MDNDTPLFLGVFAHGGVLVIGFLVYAAGVYKGTTTGKNDHWWGYAFRGFLIGVLWLAFLFVLEVLR